MRRTRAMLPCGFPALPFLVSLPLFIGFDSAAVGYQFEEKGIWLPGTGIGYHMGVDGISMPFVLLSTFLTPLSILASWKAITHRVREYMIAFLVLETMMIGMFVSLDMLMFYLFFEAVLIPMFLIIGVWGGPRRVYAAFKFFLYTLFGSVLMLVCMLAMYIDAGTTDIPGITAHQFAGSMQTWLFLGFLASFAVKVPMWPVHTWLPDAHVEAPTAGSMILAGVLLKMGGYGFLRFSLPMFPLASEFFAPLHLYAVHYRGDLYLACGIGPVGYEKDDCLFIGCAYGVCNHWYFHYDRARNCWRDVPDDQPWSCVGRTVLQRGRCL